MDEAESMGGVLTQANLNDASINSVEDTFSSGIDTIAINKNV